MLQERVFEPAVSSLLRARKLALILLGTALLQLGLYLAKLPGWPCPLLHALGIPCPGCGLTRAIASLLRGDVRTSLRFHAFAPIFVLALMLIGAAALLPESLRARMIADVDLLERRTGISTLLLAGFIIYWLARLLVLQSAFAQLIRG